MIVTICWSLTAHKEPTTLLTPALTATPDIPRSELGLPAAVSQAVKTKRLIGSWGKFILCVASISSKSCKLISLWKACKKEFSRFEKTFGKDGFDFIFWSDHGHITINKQIDLYNFFKKEKVNIKNTFHLVDSTTVRFWPKDNSEKERIKMLMSKIPEATLVNDEDYDKLYLAKDRNLYGDLFYYLNGGVVFIYTIHGFGKETKSMHGYHPNAEGNDGLFVSNKKIKNAKVTLPDVFVSTINSLGIDYNPKAKLDGNNVLS